MDVLPPPLRRVFILGPEAVLDGIEDVARRAKGDRARLVFLSLGYPVSAAQRMLIQEAVRLSAEIGVWLDALVVLSPHEAADLVESDDQVSILAGASLRRRIKSALKEKGLTGTGTAAEPLNAPFGRSRGYPRWTPSGSDG